MRGAAIVLLLLSTPLPAAEPVDLFSIDLMAASPAGDAVALATNASPAAVLTVWWPSQGARRTASFGHEEIDAILADAAVADLAWSPDGRLLAVELVAREGDSAIALLDLAKPRGLAPVTIEGHDNLALPRWSPKGTELWAVHGDAPESGDEDETGGIFRLDVRSRQVTRILENVWVSDFRVSGTTVTALVEGDEAEDGSVLGKLIRVDLKTGARETIFQQRSAPSGRRGVISL
ncbi:MAG TPA: LpqB family beta-propeller domain-containing protein [Thermoanaerobaculia bacterium]